MNEEHLEMLRSCLPGARLPERWGAKDPNAMAIAVGVEHHGQIPVHPHGNAERQRYSEVLAYSSDPETPIQLAAVSIFAWGGMRQDNGVRIFREDLTDWREICRSVREGSLSRKDAYKAFVELRPKVNGRSSLPGVGPAYWTKLIHFLMPSNNARRPAGYILDQWAGSSVNMICERNVVKMDRRSALDWRRRGSETVRRHSAIVSELTTPDEYEDFCCKIEVIASRLERSTEAIDCAFMSLGAGDWRGYLTTNYLDANEWNQG